MTGTNATLLEVEQAVERAVLSGDGRGVIRQVDRWIACVDAIGRSGGLPDAAVRDFVRECAVRNEHWIAAAIQARKRLAGELERTACARRQGGMIRKMYAAAPNASRHICRNG